MQYRWCGGKRGSGNAPDRPRRDSSLRGLVVVKNDLIATAAFGLVLYICWLRFRVQVHRCRLDRRDYFDPPTGRAWVRPAPKYRR